MRELTKLFTFLLGGVVLAGCFYQSAPNNNELAHLLFSAEDVPFPQSLVWIPSPIRKEYNTLCAGQWLISEFTNRQNQKSSIISSVTECNNPSEAIDLNNFVLLPHPAAIPGSSHILSSAPVINTNSFNGLCEVLPNQPESSSQNIKQCKYVARYGNIVIELIITQPEESSALSEQYIFDYFANKVDVALSKSSK